MRLMCVLRGAGIVGLLGLGGCADVEATNPYDPASPESVQAPGTLTGRVLLPGGAPAVAATVGLAGTSISTETDAGGAYTLTGVPQGGHALTVALTCYQRVTIPTPFFGLGDALSAADVVLEGATGVVTGQVAFAGGPGARFAEVSVFVPGGQAGTRPGDDGRFTLTGVPACAGQSVAAVAYGYGTVTQAGVTVAEGATLALPDAFTLVPLPGAVVGRLVLPADEAGSPEHLPVVVHAFGGETVTGETGPEGAFRLAVPQGPATFVAEVPGFRAVTAAVAVPPASDESVVADLGDLRLEPAFERVAGTLTLADAGDPTAARLTLSNAERQYLTTPGPGGAFEFSAVRAGTYTLGADAFGYAPPSPPPDVVVADGAPVVGLALNLAVRPGVLCGRLVFPPEDGVVEPPAPETAGCPPLDPGASTLADAEVRVPTSGATTATVQADGYFRLTPRAGFHTVEVVRPGYETVQRFNAQVGDDPAAPTDLGAVRMDYAHAPLSGRVEVEDCPAHPVLVSVVATGPHGTQLVIANVAGAQADAPCVRDGLFDFPALPEGDYELLVSSDDYVAQRVAVSVPQPAGAPALDVRLAINPATLGLTLSAEGLAPVPDDRACDAESTAAFGALEAALVGTDVSGRPDCHGRVVLSGLRAGTYALRLSGGDAYGELIVPTVTLSPGARTDLGQQSLPYATGGLVGRVTVPAGESPENAIVTLAGRSSAVAFAGADGTYSFFGVRADPAAVLTASLVGFRAEQAQVAILRDRVETAPDLALTLNPGAIHGRVIPEGGGSAAGTRVALLGTGIEDTTDDGSAPGAEPAVLPGLFSLTGIREGTYALELSRPLDPRFRVGTLANVFVPAGGDVDVGTIELERASGAVSVDVFVEDADRMTPEALEVIYRSAVGRLGSNTVGESTRIEANAFPVADCGEAGEPCARIIFPAVPVDAYTLTIERDGYTPGEQVFNVDADGQVVTLDSVLLPILPGQIAGTVTDPEGNPLSGVTVAPAGAAPTTTDVAGAFEATGLREGSYPLTFTKTGYASTTLPSIGVTAGLTTDIGALALAYATGTLSGTVELADGESPVGVLIVAEHADSGLIETTASDAAGRWTLAGVRSGAWLVTASRDAYSPADADTSVSEDATTEVETLTLAVDPGRILGRVVLGDHDPDASPADAVVEVGPSDFVDVVVGADGAFATAGLKAGTYTLTVTLTDYVTRETAALTVRAGEDLDIGDLVLADTKAPEAPTLVMDPAFTPLSGFPESPAVVAANLIQGDFGTVSVTFDPDGVNPTHTDANFDPAAGLGHWEIRGPGLNRFVAAPVGPPFPFVVGLNQRARLRVRAVDASGNAGSEAEIEVMALDRTAPEAPRFGDELPEGCKVDGVPPVGRARRCVLNVDALNVPLIRPLDSKGFGCFFVKSRELVAENIACTVDAECQNGMTCQAGVCFDALSLPWAPETDECYAEGTPYVTVFPTGGERTFHCVRAYDQAGLASAPTCLMIEDDSTAPAAPDLFPNDVEVRGETVRLALTLAPGGLDPNFRYFEKKLARAGANWEAATDDENLTGEFTYTLVPGSENELSLRAVDWAGNVSEATSVTIDESSYGLVQDDAGGIGYSPDLHVGRISWAHPTGCDPNGQGKSCHFGLILRDDATQHESSYQVGTASTCFRDCMPGTLMAPLAVQTSFGLFYTDFVPAAPPALPVDTMALKVIPYGADGDPNTGDEAALQDDCCATLAQNPDPTAAIVWLGASERVVTWVRRIQAANSTTWKGYALALNDDGAGLRSPADLAVAQTLHQVATASPAVSDTPTSFSVSGDTLVFAVGGTAKAWAKILAGANSVAGDVSLPAAVPGRVHFVAATQEGIAGIFAPTAAPEQRRLFQTGSIGFRNATAAGSCANNACPNGGCFKGQCFTVDALDAVPDLTCGADNADYCGVPQALTSDGGLLAATVRFTRNGEDYDRVILSTGRRATPRALVTRPGPLHDVVVDFDRLVAVDASTGAARLLAIEPTDLTWRGLGASATVSRHHPRPMGSWTAFVAERADGRPGLSLIGRDRPELTDDITLVLPPNAAAHAADIQPWPNGRGFATAGTLLGFTEVLTTANNQARARLTVIDTGVLCAAGQAGCTAFRACTVDGATCRDFKQISAETVTLTGALAVLPAGRVPLDVALSGGQVMLHTTQGLGANVFSYLLRDFALNTTYSNLATPIRGADVAANRITQCDAAGFLAMGGADRLACLNRIAGNAPWEVRLVARANAQTGWNSAATTLTLFNTNDAQRLSPLGNGQPSEVFIVDDRTLVLESVVGTGPGQSFPLLRISTAPGQTLGGNADEYALLFQRVDVQHLGLGRVVLAPPDRLVFADSLLTLQPEIFRISAHEGGLERLTYDDAVQVEPGASSSGVITFLDHRYTTTAQGGYLPRPAFTVRGLP